jgi:tripartite-type tricarboxylate transporter receptor subunit TctC
MNKTVLAAVLAGCAHLGVAHADTTGGFPSKSVRLVVPFAAGGTSDVLARMLGLKLSEEWKQSVIVENRPGADGNLGAEAVAKSPADGYTVLLVDTSTLTISPAVMAKMGYEPLKDLQAVSMLSFSPYGLVVNPKVPAKSFRELVAYGKANPGKLNFSAGTMGHKLVAAQLKSVAGLDWLTVPYKGGAVALNAVISGEADATVVGLLSAIPQVQGQRVRALAVTGTARSETLPDAPTLAESGVPGFVAGSWQGALVPKGTPEAVVQKLSASFAAALRDPEVKAKLLAQGTEAIGDTPDRFAAFLERDTKRWKTIALGAGIQPE